MGSMKDTRENKMTKDEALAYIADEMEMTLDDNYPDRMESLVDELIEDGCDPDDAEKWVFGGEWA